MVFFIRGTGQNSKIVFTPHWIPQAQFAGYYAALDQGYYREAGLDVEILHLTANISSFEYLKTAKADVVSSFLMDAIRQKAAGVPIKNIGQLSQHSALMMITKKESGIDEAAKLHNKTLGIWSSGFDDVPIAFMRERNYSIELVRILNTVNLFLMDGVNALTVMYYNEYDQVINSGVNEDELNTFFFADYGLDIPEDGLYCLEKTLLTKKEELTKFVQATLKGWEFAYQNREYTIDLVVKEMAKAHLPNNKAHQRWMLDRMLELIEPGDKNVGKGQLAEQDFCRALNILRLTSPGFPLGNIVFENFYQPLLNE
jgi:NitT/TauT family transport system substrate-binding protein